MEVAKISLIFGKEKKKDMEVENCKEDTPEPLPNSISNEDNNNHLDTDYDKIPVYISYASENTSGKSFTETKQNQKDKNQFVEDLVSQLKDTKIKYKIDKSDVYAGGNIDNFEKEIGNAKIVIIILSDKYLTSPHCMYEWTLIHNYTYAKKIIYVIFDNEIIINRFNWFINWFKKKEIDFTDRKYKMSLYDRWSEYMKDCVNKYHKNNNNYSTIDKHAFDNHFYLKEIDNVLKIVSDHNTLKSSDNNCIPKIISAVDKYLKQYKYGNESSPLDENITKAIWKKTILVIGDNILKYSIQQEKGRLGDYFDKKLYESTKDNTTKNLREWCAKYYEDVNIINTLGSDKIQNGAIIYEDGDTIDDSDLKTLIKSNLFDIIISVGYSKQLFRTVQLFSSKQIAHYQLNNGEISEEQTDESIWMQIVEYARDNNKKEIKDWLFGDVKNQWEEQEQKQKQKQYSNQTDTNSTTRENVIFKVFRKCFEKKYPNTLLSCFFDIPTNVEITNNYDAFKKLEDIITKKNKDKIIYIDLLRRSGAHDIIISEAKIVEFINSCIIALYNYNITQKPLLNNRYVLTLGTNFPTWALRFMWERLTNNNDNRENALINNKFINDKTGKLISVNGGYVLKDESITAFINKFQNLEEKYHKEWKEGFYNCYVSYLPGNEEGFKDFVDKYLKKIEDKTKFNFVWHKNPTNNDDKDYKLKIYYFDTNTANNYNREEKHGNTSAFQDFDPNSLIVMNGPKELCYALELKWKIKYFIDISNKSEQDLLEGIRNLLNIQENGNY